MDLVQCGFDQKMYGTMNVENGFEQKMCGAMNAENRINFRINKTDHYKEEIVETFYFNEPKTNDDVLSLESEFYKDSSGKVFALQTLKLTGYSNFVSFSVDEDNGDFISHDRLRDLAFKIEKTTWEAEKLVLAKGTIGWEEIAKTLEYCFSENIHIVIDYYGSGTDCSLNTKTKISISTMTGSSLMFNLNSEFFLKPEMLRKMADQLESSRKRAEIELRPHQIKEPHIKVDRMKRCKKTNNIFRIK